MEKSKRLVIIGDSAFAEVAFECFSRDSEYEVVAFAVERAYLKSNELFGIPVIPLEELERHFAPEDVYFYAALVYSQLNRLRTRLYQVAKSKGYKPASYISSRALVWPNVKLGEHCFIFEQNNLQPFVTIGSNVVLWSGNHIGHHSNIGDNCFISSHVVVSGFCNVGSNTFIGVNSSLANNINVGCDNWIGTGVTVSRNVADNQILKIDQPDPSKISATRFFRVKNEVD